jgi:hypothetical protein
VRDSSSSDNRYRVKKRKAKVELDLYADEDENGESAARPTRGGKKGKSAAKPQAQSIEIETLMKEQAVNQAVLESSAAATATGVSNMQKPARRNASAIERVHVAR